MASPLVEISINDAGDVAFQANSTMDPDVHHSKVYFRRAATGKTQLIPPPTDVVRYGSLVINARDEIVFGGHYLPYGQGGVYLRPDRPASSPRSAIQRRAAGPSASSRARATSAILP